MKLSRPFLLRIGFAVLGILIFTGIALTLPHFLGDVDAYVVESPDWQLQLSWAASARQSILYYGQFPIWNPFRCGGVPVIGEPESNILSLYLPFLLLFGPVLGYIALFALSLGIGLYGFWRLSRYFAISPAGSVLVGAIYMLSGLFVMPFAVGMTNFIAVCYLPYLTEFTIKYFSYGRLRHAILAGFFTALMFLSGFHYIPIIILYLITLAALAASIHKDKKPILMVGIILLFFVGFSAIKLFRSSELLLTSPEIQFGYETDVGYSINTLFFSLLSRHQTFDAFQNIGPLVQGFWGGRGYEIDEHSMYTGIVVLLLFFLGIAVHGKKYKVFVGVFIVFLFFAFGSNITPSPFSFLKEIPILSSMRVAQRFRYIFMIPFVFFAGLGFDTCFRFIHDRIKTSRRPLLVVTWLAASMIIFDILFVSILIFKNNFSVTQISLSPPEEFRNHCLDAADEYAFITKNQGNVHCQDNMLFEAKAICSESERNRGKVFLQNGHGTERLVYFSPNKIQIEATFTQPDTLIVNQNFRISWHALINGEPIKPRNADGLIAIDLEKGTYKIILYFLPKTLVVGAVITIGTIIWAIRYMLIDRRKKQI